jgi:cold shock CspA family protein
MRYGTVVQYFPAKGFGFIRPDSGPDIFFHITALGACESQLQIEPGQPVKYELVPGTERKFRSRPKRSDEDSTKPEQLVHPRAKLVELIDKIPGAILEEDAHEQHSARHPRARQKKPSWRR